MTERIIENQEVTETQNVLNLISGVEIGSFQADYRLREIEFERIKNGKPVTFNWANSIALTSFGFALNLLAKGYSDPSLISKGEWVALASGVMISVTLYLIGLKLPNDRKKVMQDIETHFKNAPAKPQFQKGES